MQIRDRIRELRRVPAAELLPNPRNWRTHPPRQRDALLAVLAEVGYADALLARETSDGRLMLIDGHLRAEATPQTVVPVLVLDVTEEEAAKLLATLDPLSALAGADSERLAELLSDVHTENAALGKLLEDLARQQPALPGEDADDGEERQFHIIVTCDSEQRQVELLQQFTEEGLQCRAFVA